MILIGKGNLHHRSPVDENVDVIKIDENMNPYNANASDTKRKKSHLTINSTNANKVSKKAKSSTSAVEIAQDPSPSDTIIPGPNDYCIGLKINLPKANLYFRNEVIGPIIEAYASATNASKGDILKSLIDSFKSQGGHFLTKSKKHTGYWEQSQLL